MLLLYQVYIRQNQVSMFAAVSGLYQTKVSFHVCCCIRFISDKSKFACLLLYQVYIRQNQVSMFAAVSGFRYQTKVSFHDDKNFGVINFTVYFCHNLINVSQGQANKNMYTRSSMMNVNKCSLRYENSVHVKRTFYLP